MYVCTPRARGRHISRRRRLHFTAWNALAPRAVRLSYYANRGEGL